MHANQVIRMKTSCTFRIRIRCDPVVAFGTFSPFPVAQWCSRFAHSKKVRTVRTFWLWVFSLCSGRSSNYSKLPLGVNMSESE